MGFSPPSIWQTPDSPSPYPTYKDPLLIWLFLLMNWPNMHLSSLFKKNGNHKLNTSVTYISHELIQYAFANHTFENKNNHKLSTYIKYVSLFSWTDSICIFKLVFWEKIKLQIEHMYHFLFSWTDPTCIFKLPF